MTERRQHPCRHRAILRLVAGLSVAATLAAPAGPSLAESSRESAPSTRVHDDRVSDLHPDSDGPAPSDADGRRARTDREATAAAASTGRSVRPRGEAAPVRLGPTATPVATLLLPVPAPAATSTPTPDAVQPDRAPLNQPLGSERRYAVPKKPEIDTGIRVWPMREGEYTFSQEYGCVQQISGFYPAAEGCPADRPVVHSGLDFAADTGTLIYAAASGWVTEAGLDRETGLANTRLVIQHEGKNRDYATEYLHWISTFVEPGDYVRAGEPVAEVGSVGYSTGPHLHFAVIDFRSGDYLDPRAWLPDDVADGDYRESRRERPRTRFADRSAGVPDYHDPAPAPAPTRQPVPEASASASGSPSARKTAGEDRKHERRQRRAERRDRLRAATPVPTATGDAAAPSGQRDRPDRSRPERSADDAAPDGSERTRERTRDQDRSSETRQDDRRRDDERGDGSGDRGGHQRDQERPDRERSAVAAVPEAEITGGLSTGTEPAAEPAPTTTPEAASPESTSRPGRAR